MFSSVLECAAVTNLLTAAAPPRRRVQAEQKAIGSKIKRGPFLAELELEYMLSRPAGATAAAAGEPEPEAFVVGDIAAVEGMVTGYFEQFGSKPVPRSPETHTAGR